MNESQHAPSPDYSQHDDLQPVTITCRECGDMEIQFVSLTEVADRVRRSRCDECQAEYDTTKRAQARAAVSFALDMAIMRQPEQVDIPCQECGETVDSFVGPADHLEGKCAVCPHCDTVGKYVLRDDDASAWVEFRAYTAAELIERGDQ